MDLGSGLCVFLVMMGMLSALDYIGIGHFNETDHERDPHTPHEKLKLGTGLDMDSTPNVVVSASSGWDDILYPRETDTCVMRNTAIVGAIRTPNIKEYDVGSYDVQNDDYILVVTHPGSSIVNLGNSDSTFDGKNLVVAVYDPHVFVTISCRRYGCTLCTKDRGCEFMGSVRNMGEISVRSLIFHAEKNTWYEL